MEAICKFWYSNTPPPPPQSTFRNQKVAVTIPGPESLKGYGRRKLCWENDQVGCKFVIMGCAQSGGGSVEAKLKSAGGENCCIEEKEEEEKTKCEEKKRRAEVMEECLESEAAAIMGEDEDGKEASDYDRRAHIFDKSSRVLQALKEEEEQDSTTTDHT